MLWILSLEAPCSFRKHAYSNILKILDGKSHHQKTESFQIKILIFFFFFFLLKNIDCGYSLEPLGKAVLTSTPNLCFEQK